MTIALKFSPCMIVTLHMWNTRAKANTRERSLKRGEKKKVTEIITIRYTSSDDKDNALPYAGNFLNAVRHANLMFRDKSSKTLDRESYAALKNEDCFPSFRKLRDRFGSSSNEITFVMLTQYPGRSGKMLGSAVSTGRGISW